MKTEEKGQEERGKRLERTGLKEMERKGWERRKNEKNREKE